MNKLIKKAAYCHAFSCFFSSLSDWQSCCRQLGWTAEITQETYDVLLKGVWADVQIPLWASCAKGSGRPLMDATTYELISHCKSHGYAPRRIDGNPPDYIGEQFAYLRYLYASALQQPELEAAADEFIVLYTTDTLKAYVKALRECALSPEAEALAEDMQDFICGDAEEFSVPEALEAELRAISPREPIAVEQPHIVNSAGLNNCGGKCKINITVAEGCALEISTDDTDNAPQLRACLRGRAYRHTFLTPRRLRYPMKRVGKRGEGKFRRISWDEAYSTIAQKTAEAGRKYGPGSRYLIYASGSCGCMRPCVIFNRLINLDGGSLNFYNSYSNACCGYVMPYIYGDNTAFNSEWDVLNSKLIILWGHNPSETIFGSYSNFYLAQAREKGIPIIVIDPRRSDTALALADEWIPLRPSTDGAMADAMAYEIVSRGLHDLDFIHRFSQGFDAESMPEGFDGRLSYLSYLTGEADGVVKDAEWGAAITGVPAGTIRSLAVRYATTKPAAIIPGYGPQRHGNGEQGTRGMAALACLTGNVGVSGGSSGASGHPRGHETPMFPEGSSAYPGRIPTFLWLKAVEQGTQMDKVADGLKGVERLDSNIKVIYNLAGNVLINQHADINHTVEVLSDETKCEFIVGLDLFMTPSSKFADILLPGASVFESDDISAPWANDPYLVTNCKVVEPLFESLDDYEWISGVARKMGYWEDFSLGLETKTDWLRKIYEELQQYQPELPPFDEFRANGGYQYKDPPLVVAYQEQIEKGVPFKTPSGKIELFSPQLYDMHDPDIPALPSYLPCMEGPHDTLREKYPLQLIGYHTKRRCHSIHDNNDWLEEVDPPALWIHPLDAEARGISHGSMVEVFNDRGVVRIPARVTDRIMPGVTALSQGGWYTPAADGTDIRGSINVLTSYKKATPLAKGNPQHTNLVEVRLAE